MTIADTQQTPRRSPGRESKELSFSPTAFLAGDGPRVELPAIPPERQPISPAAAREVTKAELTNDGRRVHGYFAENMPEGYRLPWAHRVGILNRMPHLGWCRVTSIGMHRADGTRCVVGVFYANFLASLNTNPGEQFFRMENLDRSQMFFGVAFTRGGINNQGPLEIDRSVHQSGISFVAQDARAALAHVIALKTGFKPEVWKSLIRMGAEQRAAEKAAMDRAVRKAR